jgi:sugar phosphate isomerase/epimerase
MTVCIEPLNRGESNVLNSVLEAMELAREADHDRVRVLADLYHLVLEAEPMAHLVEADIRISHVHVADTERRAPGQGTYPYQAFFSTLQEIDYDNRCSVECHWDNLRTESGPALEYLQGMWARSSV